MPYDARQLLTLSQRQLDELFSASAAGRVPDGEATGTMIIAPGTSLSPAIARLISLFAWQGKIFDAAQGVLRNRILPFGVSAVSARAYKEASWLDGKECIVLDYSDTSLIARWIRDEIREISPGVYLGKVYWGRRRLIDFALEF
jgi:hypothetical protein